MKATARRITPGIGHRIDIRGHQVTVDEGAEHGGADDGPTPQELFAASIASCTATTMEMYANRKGWDIGQIEVECEYETPERGAPTQFKLVLRFPDTLSEEQVEKLQVIAGKCPVHRAIEGESTFEERVELVAPAGT